MKKFVFQALKIVVSAGLIALALQNVELERLSVIIIQTQVAWLFVSLAFLSLSYVLGAMQWQWILQMAGLRLPYPKTLSYYYVGLFFNNFLISGMGGDVLRVYDVQKHSPDKERLSPALATVFFDRFMGLLTLLFLAGLMTSFVIGRETGVRFGLAILGLFFLWVLALIVLFHRPTADRIVKPMLRFLPDRFYTRLQHLYAELHRFKSNPWSLLRLFSLSIIVQFLRILTIWAVGRAIGDSSLLLYYVIFVPVISLAASLPISVGGTGPREHTTIFLFGKIGVTAVLAFSIGFLSYLINLVSTLPGAIIFVTRSDTKHGR